MYSTQLTKLEEAYVLIQHFLFECPNYSMQREKFKQSAVLSCGIRDSDTELLFSVTEKT